MISTILSYFIHSIDDHLDVDKKQINSCIVSCFLIIVFQYQHLSSSLKLMAEPAEIYTRLECHCYQGSPFS